MRILLNTLYVTTPEAYLSKDGLNVVVSVKQNEIFRIPIHNIEQIITFGYMGASPGLMKLCADNYVSLTFLSPQGRYISRSQGPTRGNVLLRKAQYKNSDEPNYALHLSKLFIGGKIQNYRNILRRFIRDNGDDEAIERVCEELLRCKRRVLNAESIDSVMVSDQEVIQEVEQRIAWLADQIGSKEKMEEYYNKSYTQIREMLRENVKSQKTVVQMQQKIVGDIKLTPAEVRNYFSKLPQDSIPFIPTQVEVQIITQEPKISEEEIERVKSQLREYADRVNKGETSFSTLARFYSEDPGTARRGGEGGFTGRGELVPEFANVVFNLTDTKKVSKVFETEFGYHIAQLIEKRGDRVNYRHILLRPKVDQKDIDAALARLDSIADDIRKNKFTFDDAATWIF
jgi:parvulin-like peptidyl-prolyl isomerase